MINVSVIIPTYNRQEFTDRAIESVCNQSYRDYEIVVVDDGSTVPFINNWGNKISLIRLGENRGVSFARNRGVDASRGQWISFLDSDDIWKKDKLKIQMKWLYKNSTYKICQTQEEWIRNNKFINIPNHLKKVKDNIFKESAKRCVVTASSVIIKREIFNEIGYFDESLIACEDYDLWLRISAKYRVGLVDTVLMTRFGGHEDQLSTTTPVMDQYRITSLVNLLYSNRLDNEQFETIKKVLLKKCEIVYKGYEKRNKLEESNRYKAIYNKVLDVNYK